VLWCASIGRGLLAGFHSASYLRRCERIGTPAPLAGSLPVRMLDRSEGLMVLAGVFRPVLILSRSVAEILEPRQLEAAIAHEGAHWASRDNLRRLLILLTPGLFPFFGGFHALEEAWSRFSEWAADDLATAGNGGRSLALAEALVGVARLGVAGPPHLLATPLLRETEEIRVRVDRLLRLQCSVEPVGHKDRVLQLCASFLLLVALGALLVRPGTMEAAHEAIEQLIR
jgi:Zn-dependent protease with chaperone function